MRRITNIMIALLACASMWATPARRDGRIMVDADGVAKMVYMHGNEDFHFLTDESGTWLDEESLLPMSETEKNYRKSSGKQRLHLRRARQTTGLDRLLAPKGPVILVNFSDTVFSHTKEQMIEWATGEDYSLDGATGSIRQYFRDNSYGQYVPQLDFYGPVTVSRGASYYGSNDSRGNDLRPDEMVVEACRLAHEQGADFSQYDYNNDGEVDWVVIVYAGKGEADSYEKETIWPHQYTLSSTQKSFKLDGKTIDRYCCTNEISYDDKLAGIGIFIHEFSHILGLPDIYSTDYNSTHKTNGEWDIMDYGCYNNNLLTPPMYSAYERWWMGWIEPTLLNSAATITLDELNSSSAAGYLTADGDTVTNILSPTNPNTFYVLENRQQNGWDAYLPGHGLLITKIQFSSYKWQYNAVNKDASALGVDIIEADGLSPRYPQNGHSGKQGDAYPTDLVNSFTLVTNYQLTDIAETNGVITFDINGGGSPTYLDVQEPNSTEAPRKILQNGHVVILRGEQIYDLLGRQL